MHRIALFEDSRSLCVLYRDVLASVGHEVVMVCTSMEASRDALNAPDTPDFDVAIVDGNMSFGKISGVDGAEICQLIRQRRPGTRIVGNSAGDDVRGADEQASKSLNYLIDL